MFIDCLCLGYVMKHFNSCDEYWVVTYFVVVVLELLMRLSLLSYYDILVMMSSPY